MLKKVLCAAVGSAIAVCAYAESNVTLYGVLDTAVTVTKHKNQSAKVMMDDGIYGGNRFGFKGTEDLGNGYSVGFILEQGFQLSTGAEGDKGKAFNRESLLQVTSDWGQFAFGRAGGLSSDNGTYTILRGSALWTSYYTDGCVAGAFITTDRYDNLVVYRSPEFGGATVTAMYSNGTGSDDQKWAKNSHYYGLGLDYSKNNTGFSAMWEMLDNKDMDAQSTQLFTIGGSQGFGNLTVHAGYQFALHSQYLPAWISLPDPVADGGMGLESRKGVTQNAFTASIGYQIWGGEWKLQGNYAFGKYKATNEKYNIWSVGTAYEYPFSKRTMVYSYAGYGQANKMLKESSDFNSWTLTFGINHTF